ncbi:hypothetical protein B0H66DRAFT_179798 [Apodospora peruviana]|uniref:Zn(2)-C6 fungal-type domain-containing protein n=1 Tax=Apodospora peruviana TaxID=516989 RepID=A0AAE0IB02_9PEZI|nr:hypothetical protein B0H66DRAFT_179798 [Apodospora peruviana]
MDPGGYPPLQPRPPAPRGDGHDGEPPERPNFPIRKHVQLPSVRKTVAACEACRSKKIRCDGQRPTCGPCHRKGRECIFIAAPGMSRYAGMRAEVERLHTQLGPKTNDNSISTSVLRQSPVFPSQIETEANQVPCYPPADQSRPLGGDQPSQTHYNVQNISPSLSPFPLGSMGMIEAQSQAHGDLLLARSVGNPFDPDGIIRSLRDKVNVIQQAFVYFHGTGNFLFSIPAPLDAVVLLDDATNAPAPETKLKLCQFCAVAAVGARYSGGRIPDEFENYLYSVSKLFLDDCIEANPTVTMRVCALLVARNVVAKDIVALVYAELGLAISRTLGLINQQPPAWVSVDDWPELKQIWRCLLMLHFWLDAGGNWRSGDVIQLSGTEELVLQVPAGLASDEGFFLREMAKIAILKKKIFQVVSSQVNNDFCLWGAVLENYSPEVQDVSLSNFSLLRQSLDVWYEALPSEAKISNIASTPLLSWTRFQLYSIHLMHLGAVLLLFRHLVRRYGDTEESAQMPEDLMRCVNDGLLAARHSVRICYLLDSERTETRRCWILMSVFSSFQTHGTWIILADYRLLRFQSFVAGCVLVHFSFQNLLLGRVDAGLDDDLALTERVLALLARYSAVDSIARNFHRTLQTYVELVQDLTAKRRLDALEGIIIATPWGSLSSATDQHYLLSSVRGASAYHTAAQEVLGLVAKPFGDERVRPESSGFLFRHTLINHEECSLGIHQDWISEFYCSETSRH